MGTDVQDYQDYLDYQKYQAAQKPVDPNPEGLEIKNAETATWPTGTDWIRQGLYGVTGDELFNGIPGMPLDSNQDSVDPDTGKVTLGPLTQEPGIRKTLGTALEIGGGVAAGAGAAATIPESFGTTALAIPAAFTGGQLAGHGLGEELGLLPPESLAHPNDPNFPGVINPATGKPDNPGDENIYNAGNIARRFAMNAAVPGALATADRLANRGVLGSIPFVNPRDGIMYDNDVIDTNNAAAKMSGGGFTSVASPAAMNDPGLYGAMTDADPAVAQMNIYGGGKVADTGFDPETGTHGNYSPTFGQFRPGADGSTNTSASDVAATLKSQMPEILKARGAVADQYDAAFKLVKQADPNFKGVTFDDVFNTPELDEGGVPIPNSSLNENFSKMMDTFGRAGDGEKAKTLAGVYQQLSAPFSSDDSLGMRATDLGPSDAMGQLQQQYQQLRELAAFDPNAPQSQLAAQRASVPFMMKAQALFRAAMYKNAGDVYSNAAAVPGAGTLPLPDSLQTLNEMWHNLDPLSQATEQTVQSMDKGINGLRIPTIPANKPAAASHNVFNPMSGSFIPNSLATKAINGLEDPQYGINNARGDIVDANEAALGNAQQTIDLKLSPKPNIPLANTPAQMLNAARGVPGAMASTMGGGIDASALASRGAATTGAMAGAAAGGGAVIAVANAIKDANAPTPPQMTAVRPNPLALPLAAAPVDNKQGPMQLPRNISKLNTQSIANLIPGYAAPQDMQPLVFQWQRAAQSGDRKLMAQFLGAFSQAHPDFPLARGAVTGLPTEFDIGDGKTRLFSNVDKSNWEQQIENSPLRADEKAQRVMSLRQDGIVIPMTTKVSAVPAAGSSQDPTDQALGNMMQGGGYAPRVQTPLGSRRMEQ